MNESTALFQIIEMMTNKIMKKLSYDKEGVILSKTPSGYYKVIPNGEKHEIEIKNGTEMNFNTGDKCLIHYVNGDYNNRVIIAKL